MARPDEISVVIPTYGRGAACLDTVRHLLAADGKPGEILLVDQTERHPDGIAAELDRLERQQRIRRIVQSPPSIVRAMNTGLLQAHGRIVLFLDDDVVPCRNLVAAHADRHDGPYAAVSGQVLQPGQQPVCASRGTRVTADWLADLDFSFNGTVETEIRNVMAGNLSVIRQAARAVGGFDENFIGSAYRFETDFARRLEYNGYRILFAPDASLRHLRLPVGGTRSQGDHLRKPDPLHSLGDYYFALRHGCGRSRAWYIARRPFRESINRFYARHPWLLPVKFASECRAYGMALRRARTGARLLTVDSIHPRGAA